MMTLIELTGHLLGRLREVQERLGADAPATDRTAFAEAVDSMGLVEFVGVVAADCGVKPEEIEQAVNRRFISVADLAKALHGLRVTPRQRATQGTFAFAQEREPTLPLAWLASWATGRPKVVEPSVATDRLLERPAGWLAQHAGIQSRWRWDSNEDPFALMAEVAWLCVPERQRRDLTALLVTSEAPPRAPGLGAAAHHLLGLPARVPALEIGGACVGLLHAFWVARRLVRPREGVLVVAVEAHSQWLVEEPGQTGENAALFGDGAAACLLTGEPQVGTWPLRDVLLGCDGGSSSLIEIGLVNDRFAIDMDGPALALRAVDQLAAVVRQVCEQNGLDVEDLEAVYVHAGNGRMPPLVARKLNLPDDRVISTTAFSGNLGSVSLLAALTHRRPRGEGPVVLAAVGAGLNWGAALFDAPVKG